MNTNQLTLLLSKCQSEAQLALLLDALLTSKEKLELNNRIEILRRLGAGQTQREIASALGVGIATVSRGAKARAEGHFQALEELL